MDLKDKIFAKDVSFKFLEELREINFHLKNISDSLKKDSDEKEGAEKHET